MNLRSGKTIPVLPYIDLMRHGLMDFVWTSRVITTYLNHIGYLVHAAKSHGTFPREGILSISNIMRLMVHIAPDDLCSSAALAKLLVLLDCFAEIAPPSCFD